MHRSKRNRYSISLIGDGDERLGYREAEISPHYQ
jgi:hypothetical protein